VKLNYKKTFLLGLGFSQLRGDGGLQKETAEAVK
jgi:hypothetical protein